MKKILVPVDFSKPTEKVVNTALELARRLDAKVYLLHVAEPEPAFIGYEPGPQSERDAVAGDLKKEHEKLKKLKSILEKAGIRVEAHLRRGAFVEKILQQAEQENAGLIVMGSHGHSALFDLLVGSVAEGVLRHSTRPVLIVPSQSEEA